MGRGNTYTPEEEDLIRQLYKPHDSKISCKLICQEAFARFGTKRNSVSIRKKACALGLSRPRARKWEQEELDIVNKFAGELPVNKITMKINRLCKEKGWSGRTSQTVRNKMHQLEYDPSLSAIEGKYLNVSQLSKAFGVTNSRMSYVLREYKSILKPQYTEKFTLVHIKNIKAFIKRYPGEVARFNPDITWLLTIAFSDWQIKEDY